MKETFKREFSVFGAVADIHTEEIGSGGKYYKNFPYWRNVTCITFEDKNSVNNVLSSQHDSFAGKSQWLQGIGSTDFEFVVTNSPWFFEVSKIYERYINAAKK